MMHGPLPAPNQFDRPFFDSAREDLLRLPKCEACGHLFFPPAKRCPACGGMKLVWTVLSGRGRLWSWVVFHRQYFADMPPPYTVVRVQLEEGPYLLGNLVDTNGREPFKDAPMRVVFKPTGELVLPHFTFA